MPKGGARKGAGRKPHQFSDADLQKIEALSGYGMPAVDIAVIMEVDFRTLVAHAQGSIDKGRIKANAKIASTLFDRATKQGDTTAAIWWTKARMKWSEKHEHEHTGAGGGAIQIVTGIDRTPDGTEG